MQPRFLFKTLLPLVLTLVFSSARAEPMLNGIAIHQELGKEQFLGALYAESLSDNPESMINSNLPMRMELKIVSPDGMPTRRFGRMWIEGMAINNSNTLLTAQADNMVKFDGLFKGKLLENDHIVFALTPGSGVAINVNGVQLGKIEDDNFFEMLLRTWIGRVPLSSAYRDNLLKVGNVPSNLRTRFDGITFSSARAAAIANWTASAEPPQVATRREPPRPQVAAEESRISTPAISTPRLELPSLDSSIPAVDGAPARPATTEPSLPAAELATASQPDTPAATPPVAIATPTETSAPTSTEDEDDEYQPALTAQSLLARQFYVSDILKKIRTNTQYPRRAQDRNQEGGMRISITVDRNGNIQDMSWLEESKYSLLNKEAWEAVKRSAPFPPMPEALAGRTFEFTAPISFEMAK